MKEKHRKNLLFALGLACLISIAHIVGCFFRLPEFHEGYFYLIEGQLRVLVPIAAASLALFFVVLAYHLHRNRKDA